MPQSPTRSTGPTRSGSSPAGAGNWRVPAATYRLQLHQRFTLQDAARVADYLAALGIEDIYASPILTATRGATHGYHTTDPTRVNPELGGEEGLGELRRAMESHRLGLLLDIVPNHLAASIQNPWWVEVLEQGPSATHAAAFDIDWAAGRGRLVLPILGRSEGEVLAEGELTIGIDEDGLHFRYFDTRLPLDPATYAEVLRPHWDVVQQTLGPDHPATRSLFRLVETAQRIPPRDSGDPAVTDERRRLSEDVKHRLVTLYAADEHLYHFVDENLRLLNETPDRLGELLARQAYQPTFWRSGVERINYRRFFDITDLVGVRVEDPDVFAATHERLLQLVADRTVTGLRIDHIDGLRDPLGYLRELQDAASPARRAGDDDGVSADDLYVVVEKILEGDEPLAREWPTAGTTGYELLTAFNALFVDQAGLTRLDEDYRRFTGQDVAAEDLVRRRKQDALEQLFRGEVRVLAERLSGLAARLPDAPDASLEDLSSALVALTACFPVYRSYARDERLPKRDRPYLEAALRDARRWYPQVDADVLAFLGRVLRLELPPGLDPETGRDWVEFVLRWQQLTGPAMAKGFEDTAFYQLNRLVSLNEVGVDAHGIDHPPDRDEVHARIAERATRWPRTLNATSTHDTKRSEDVRARLNVLSELPGAWAEAVQRWAEWNGPRRRDAGGELAPDRNEEWMLYQNLVGMWPLEEATATDLVPGVRPRVHEFMLKAAREAKVHTSWLDPDAAHEDALRRFVDEALDDTRFVEDVDAFVRRIALAGVVNGLAQVVLKLAAPGVPDFYQGTELWDLSLVDPDNRRPVDYRLRRRLLDDVRARAGQDRAACVKEVRDSWHDGRVKLLVTWSGLALRRERAELFRDGDYLPLAAEGEQADRVVAFARRLGDSWVAAVVPRWTFALAGGDWPLGEVWADTRVPLPEGAEEAVEVFTGEPVPVQDGYVLAADVFRDLPVALLASVL